jgi:hypothetical protein
MRGTGSACIICCHPFLSGRPSRLKVITDLIRAALDHGDVDIVRCDDLASRLIPA